MKCKHCGKEVEKPIHGFCEGCYEETEDVKER